MPSTSRRDALRLLGLAGVASVAGCNALGLDSGPNEQPPESLGTSWTPATDSWQFQAADLRNTAQSPHGVGTQPTVEWQNHRPEDRLDSFLSGEVVAATPQRVIMASEFENERRLDAYDADAGDHLWNRPLGDSADYYVSRFGGLVDGTMYLAGSGAEVVAVDASDGTVRWRRNLGEHVASEVPGKYLSAPNSATDFPALFAATPEIVYVQSPYGIHGLAPADGAEQWRVYLGRQAENPALEKPYGLAVTDRRVWASYGGRVRSLFAVGVSEDGPEVERVELPLEYPSTPVATGDRQVALTHDVTWGTRPVETLAVGATSDGVEWQFPGHAGDGAAAYSPLATDGERVFACVSHEQPAQFVACAVRASTGKLEWLHRESLANEDVAVSAGREFRLCRPVVAGDTLLVGYGTAPERERGHGEVLALARRDGGVEWRTDLSVAPQDLLVTSSGLYVGGQQGSVLALTG